MNITNIKDKLIEMSVEYGPRVLMAILILIIGLRVIKIITKLVRKGLAKYNVEKALESFLSSLVSVLLKAILFIAVLQQFGVEATSFIAILGAAGLAVGLALQGTLANFAGGVLILLFKPYKVGDLIDSQGVLGAVKEIQIFNTIMMSPENKTIIMPNGAVMNNHIINYSADGKIRVDTIVGISYNADMKKAKEALLEMVKSDSRVLSDPAPTVAVSELADSSVNIVIRPWCDPAVYWDVYFDTVENAKNALDAVGIEIPFPQTDIHLISDKTK
ncbi:MAG: mechanosensitive ion channel family protein [Flavobacteriales bacterium]